jgi:3'-phosphoadenosine 5'-phosphosulfate sulfotransferase (PAPS reductase)/FAD synthetase
MPTKEDLKYFQAMPLDIKVAMAKTRIREWVNRYGESGTYISFSGGKDSTVLLHLVRELYPNVEAVFVNTGLEYPEIQKFVRTFENTRILNPKKSFSQIISTYGYPVISKNVSHNTEIAFNNPDGQVMKNMFDPNKKGKYAIFKWIDLLDKKKVDFLISDKCCNYLKKKPAHEFEKETGKVPITAQMANESIVREDQWIKNGCNAFDISRPISNPMSFWTENDVFQYIYENNLRIAPVYGDVVPEDGQLSMCDVGCKYQSTGCHRTGCIFCGFGAHLDKVSRFVRLKETHPKQYNYCISGGEYDINGLWKPNGKGLGMGHVLDVLNELYSKNGKTFIEY